jgi:hypothetical protein
LYTNRRAFTDTWRESNGSEWDHGWRRKRLMKDNTKFAVNIVVYAMS